MTKAEMEELAKLREQKKRTQNYRNQYAKENYKRIICMFPIDKADLIDKARGEESISSYISNLILNDMRKKGIL